MGHSDLSPVKRRVMEYLDALPGDKAAADTYASFSWRCECGDLNRCGAGSPEDA